MPILISSVIVLYFPNQDLLKRLLISIKNQVNNIYIIDNTPSGSLGWLNLLWFQKLECSITYNALGENLGIAKAQNIGISLALFHNNDYVIFFDQDSACSDNMIGKLLKSNFYLTKLGIKVAAVGPLFLDEKSKEYSKGIVHGLFSVNRIKISPTDLKPVKVDYIISSGSLIDMNILQKIGSMKEELFIDWVDIEWGLRAKKMGYFSFIIPIAVMRHSIGDEIISLGYIKKNLHSDIRNYYIIRNACYLLSQEVMGWRWRISIFFKIPQYLIIYTFFSKSKNFRHTFIFLLRACVNGFSKKLGRFDF